MNQLSVGLARFPFTNQKDYKIRPALIISNTYFNKTHNYFWACPITSKTGSGEFEFELNANEFTGVLKHKSFIRTDFIASLEKELFLKEIGQISRNLFEKFRKEIIRNLD